MNEQNAGGVRQRSVGIVVPPYNEAHVLADSIGRLHADLETSFPFPFTTTVAHNASTDAPGRRRSPRTSRTPPGSSAPSPSSSPSATGSVSTRSRSTGPTTPAAASPPYPAAPAPPPLSCPSGRPPLPRNTWSTRHDDPRPAPGQESARRSHRAGPPTDGGLDSRARRLFTGPEDDPRWARPALWAILILATALYAWNLTSITGNTFYDAAVYSGTKSWKAFFFGALDSGSFITVDKPPFALWVMGLSARVFGYGTWQLMLPMVAAGTGSVALLYRQVKRDFGAVAGTISALVLTLTPITVAITRDTNPDPILVLLMMLGAAALMKAVRNGKLMPLVWSAVAIGFAFNTKMMQAYVVLPAFFLVYLWATNVSSAGASATSPSPPSRWSSPAPGGW